MGKAHFEQMYEDAVDLDRCAIAAAVRLIRNPSPVEFLTRSAMFAGDMSLAMRMARRLVESRVDFIEALKESVANGIHRIHMVDISTGKGHWLNKSEVMNDEEDVLNDEQFYECMMKM